MCQCPHSGGPTQGPSPSAAVFMEALYEGHWATGVVAHGCLSTWTLHPPGRRSGLGPIFGRNWETAWTLLPSPLESPSFIQNQDFFNFFFSPQQLEDVLALHYSLLQVALRCPWQDSALHLCTQKSMPSSTWHCIVIFIQWNFSCFICEAEIKKCHCEARLQTWPM